MSRRDDLHIPVRRALEKEGWTITDDPLQLFFRETTLKADLGAEWRFAAEKSGRKIAVEVKDFDGDSPISDLFIRPLFRTAIERNRINLIVFDPTQEVILQWIKH